MIDKLYIDIVVGAIAIAIIITLLSALILTFSSEDDIANYLANYFDSDRNSLRYKSMMVWRYIFRVLFTLSLFAFVGWILTSNGWVTWK
jgi:hypothetical protein